MEAMKKILTDLGVGRGIRMGACCYAPAAGNHEAKSSVEGITDPNAITSHFEIQNQDIPSKIEVRESIIPMSISKCDLDCVEIPI